ncbi:hypothetical protein [Agaribacter flavus]|uniref:Uncharacterized protein n=1 Tax=Agaribacter flavus TaxID=1902781 RepID=A0ABV7FPD6_9ALTE
MDLLLPESVRSLFEKIKVNRFWWDGVQVNIPMHCVYAVIPNPVADHYTDISGFNVPILVLGNYNVPIWDPMHKKIEKMPKYAIVLIHQEGQKFGLYAYPSDCLDESFELSYDEWFKRQKLL